MQASACSGYLTTDGAPVEVTAAATTCSTTAFLAAAYGTPASTPVDPGALLGDMWKVNNVKLIQNTQTFLGL